MPSPVVRAAALVALEGVALLVLAVVYAVGGLTADAESVAGSEVGAVMLGVGGGLLLLVARGLLRHHRRAYAPAMAVQLLAGLTAVSLLQTLPLAASVVLLVAVLAGAGLLSAEARRAFGPPPPA